MVIIHIVRFNLLKIRRKWFKFIYFVSIIKNGLNSHTSFEFIKNGLVVPSVVPPEDADAVTYVPATPPPVPDHDRILPDAMYPVR
jgi:hypothetical protein